MTDAHSHQDTDEELCEPGPRLYEQALHRGRLPAEDATPTPCLIDLGLLQPAVDDPDWLEPVSPAVVLHRLLRASGER